MKNKGFTIIELLVVVVIMVILSTVGVAVYNSAQKRARDSKRRADLKAIQNALEQYYISNNDVYPSIAYPGGIDNASYFPEGKVPVDPKLAGNYIKVTYTSTAYKICADLETVDDWDGTKQDVCVTQLQE